MQPTRMYVRVKLGTHAYVEKKFRTKESHLYSKQILGHPFEAFAYVSFFVCVLHMIDATSDQCERLDNFFTHFHIRNSMKETFMIYLLSYLLNKSSKKGRQLARQSMATSLICKYE